MTSSIPTRQSIDQLNQQSLDLRHQDIRRALTLSLQAMDQAERIDYQKGYAYGLYCSTLCRFILVENDDVLDHAFQALSLFESINDPTAQALALNLIGYIYDRQNEYWVALDYYQQSLAIRRKIGDHNGESGSLNNIGLVYFDLAQYADALEYLTQSLEVAQKIGDPESISYALSNLARVYVMLDDKSKALSYFQQALDLNKQTNDRASESSILADLALIYTQEGEYDLAIRQLVRSLEITHTTGNIHDETATLINLGLAYQENRAFDLSESRLLKAFDLASKTGDRQHQAEILTALGKNYLLQDHPAEAVEYLLKALNIANEISADQLVSDSYQMLSEAYQQLGEWQLSLESFQSFHQIWQQIYSKENDRRIRALTSKLEIEQARQEADAQRMKTAELSHALDALQRANDEKAKLLHRLEMQTKVLEQLSREDGLTGLANRRWLDIKLQEEYDRALRFDHQLTVAMIDLDDFKTVNDRFSHQVGDLVLQRVANLLREGCRSVDIVGRYGGEEFMLILVEASLDQGIQTCQRIMDMIRKFDWTSIHPELDELTISIGVSSNQGAEHLDELIGQADDRLYRAKNQGKDQIFASV